MKFLKRFLLRCFGNKVLVIDLPQDEEERILKEISLINKIDQYVELQRQGGYQLYAKTKDEKYLGIVSLMESWQRIFSNFNNHELKEYDKDDGGYKSSLE